MTTTRHLRLHIEYRTYGRDRMLTRVQGPLDGGWSPYVTPFYDWEIEAHSFFPSLEGVTQETAVTFADDIPASIKRRIMAKRDRLHGKHERTAA